MQNKLQNGYASVKSMQVSIDADAEKAMVSVPHEIKFIDSMWQLHVLSDQWSVSVKDILACIKARLTHCQAELVHHVLNNTAVIARDCKDVVWYTDHSGRFSSFAERDMVTMYNTIADSGITQIDHQFLTTLDLGQLFQLVKAVVKYGISYKWYEEGFDHILQAYTEAAAEYQRHIDASK